jgi:hypothetical protein
MRRRKEEKISWRQSENLHTNCYGSLGENDFQEFTYKNAFREFTYKLLCGVQRKCVRRIYIQITMGCSEKMHWGVTFFHFQST